MNVVNNELTTKKNDHQVIHEGCEKSLLGETKKKKKRNQKSAAS